MGGNEDFRSDFLCSLTEINYLAVRFKDSPTKCVDLRDDGARKRLLRKSHPIYVTAEALLAKEQMVGRCVTVGGEGWRAICSTRGGWGYCLSLPSSFACAARVRAHGVASDGRLAFSHPLPLPLYLHISSNLVLL